MQNNRTLASHSNTLVGLARSFSLYCLRKRTLAMTFLVLAAVFPWYAMVPAGQANMWNAANALTTALNGQRAQDSAECPTCSPGKKRVIYAPLFDLPEASGSEIVLNSRGARDIPITPTFYTLEGTSYVGEEIILHPAEIRFVDTKNLIPARERNKHRWGGISFSYFGGFMEAWAQLTLHGIHGGGSVNILFTVMSQRRSNTSNAVWWTPPDGHAVIALGNTSDQQVHANLVFSNRETRAVDVAPFGTEIVRLRRDLTAASADGEAVSINYTGPAGCLIPTGYTSSDDGKFSSMIRFYDTQHLVQQNLFANNLRLKYSVPHMVLRNTSGQVVTATPKFLTSAGDPVDIPGLAALRLHPFEVAEVNLAPLTKAAQKAGLETVTVQVHNSGDSGSLIGALYSINTKTGVAYDVPLRDSGPPRASTGAYPVRLDGDYSTIVNVTNTTDKPGEFTMQINYDGGHFVTGIVHLNAGATRTFDVRKLRDDQTPDIMGHPLPRSLKTAQARWSVRGNVKLNGRAEVVSIKDGVSSSYSCFLCCPNTFVNGWITPNSITVLPGHTQQFIAWEHDQNGYYCGGNVEPYPVGGYWYSGDESVGTVDYNGLATAIEPGSAEIACQWTVYRWEWDEMDESCNMTEEPFEDGRDMQVPKVTIQFDGSGVPLKTGTPPAGSWDKYEDSVTMHAETNFMGGSVHWSTTSNKVTLENVDSETVTVKSVTKSDSRNDVMIKAEYKVRPEDTAVSDTKAITVQQPAALEYVTTGSTVTTTTCSTTVHEQCCTPPATGKQRDITWRLMDHLNPAAAMTMQIPGTDSGTYDGANNTCSLTSFEGTPASNKEYTSAGGTWVHHYWFCTGLCACSSNGTQTYMFNGFTITQSFTYTCSAITVAGH
jgi:hypothetical protein